jgi:GGDEF domain-containing protein
MEFPDEREGEERALSVSAGFVHYPAQAVDLHDAYSKAYAALSTARRQGGHVCLCFDSSMTGK